MIEYKKVALRYTEKDVLRDVNLRIENGEFMVLVGPSGSGKTTMIKIINRLLEPTDGNIYMDGKRIKDYDERGASSFYWLCFTGHCSFSQSNGCGKYCPHSGDEGVE